MGFIFSLLIYGVLILFVSAGILFLLTKLFKVENISFRKSIKLSVVVLVAFSILIIIFFALILQLLHDLRYQIFFLIILLAVVVLIFHYSLRRYYSLSRKKSLAIFLTSLLIVATFFVIFKYSGGIPIGFSKGRILVLSYYCSDVCPQYGDWSVVYSGINSPKECEKIGGTPSFDLAWGGFRGCSPFRRDNGIPPTITPVSSPTPTPISSISATYFCNSINGSSFRSVRKLEVGLGPDGLVMGYWTIEFKGGSVSWHHSDVAESGTYSCLGNTINVRLTLGDAFKATYDPDRNVLFWQGDEYEKLTEPSDIVCPTPQYTSPHCPKIPTKAKNLKTGEIKEFPDACLPECWVGF